MRGCGDCNTLQHTATHFNVLQNTATHSNTLQRAATYYITYITLQALREAVVTATHCNTTTHCNTLQRAATRCNTQQRCLGRVPFHILFYGFWIGIYAYG